MIQHVMDWLLLPMRAWLLVAVLVLWIGSGLVVALRVLRLERRARVGDESPPAKKISES